MRRPWRAQESGSGLLARGAVTALKYAASARDPSPVLAISEFYRDLYAAHLADWQSKSLVHEVRQREHYRQNSSNQRVSLLGADQGADSNADRQAMDLCQDN